MQNSLPIVYSCSGCSSAAQMANYLAVQLDRRGLAEMSCIAGVGGDVPQLLRVAQSGRPIIAIDGCPLHCVARCLERHDIRPQRQVLLSELGVHRKKRQDFDPDEADRLLELLSAELSPANRPLTPRPDPVPPSHSARKTLAGSQGSP